MPGAFFYIRKLEKAGPHRLLSKSGGPYPVVGVNVHKAELIRSFDDDLARPGLRLAMGDPKAMAFGRVAREILSRSPLEKEILK